MKSSAKTQNEKHPESGELEMPAGPLQTISPQHNKSTLLIGNSCPLPSLLPILHLVLYWVVLFSKVN